MVKKKSSNPAPKDQKAGNPDDDWSDDEDTKVDPPKEDKKPNGADKSKKPQGEKAADKKAKDAKSLNKVPAKQRKLKESK